MPETDIQQRGNHVEAAGASRRRHERLPIEIEVNLTSDHNFYTAFTQNVSEGGLFVATNEILPIGTVLEFSFTLAPDPSPIAVRGRVRWTREETDFTSDVPPGMGIEFIDLAPDVQRRINEFIQRQRESLFYDD